MDGEKPHQADICFRTRTELHIFQHQQPAPVCQRDDARRQADIYRDRQEHRHEARRRDRTTLRKGRGSIGGPSRKGTQRIQEGMAQSQRTAGRGHYHRQYSPRFLRRNVKLMEVGERRI